MKKLFTLFALTLSTLTLSTALAHSELEGSTPEDGEVLSTAPSEIELVFSESIQMGFSTFKVYPLPANVAAEEEDTATDAAMAPLGDHAEDEGADDSHDDTATEAGDDHNDSKAADDDHAAADRAAAAFVEEVLPAEGDEAERVDEDVTSQGSKVTLTLTDDLEPGWYVAMWSALSADGHPIEGFVTFDYQP